jgi:hypothetical protein
MLGVDGGKNEGGSLGRVRPGSRLLLRRVDFNLRTQPAEPLPLLLLLLLSPAI